MIDSRDKERITDRLNEVDHLQAKVERYEAALREIARVSPPDGQEWIEAALAADTPERFCVCGFSTSKTPMPEHNHRHVIDEHLRGWTEHAETCLAADTPPGDRCPTCGSDDPNVLLGSCLAWSTKWDYIPAWHTQPTESEGS